MVTHTAPRKRQAATTDQRQSSGRGKSHPPQFDDAPVRSEERPVITWRHDDIIATMSLSEEAEYGDFEAFALAIDALLP